MNQDDLCVPELHFEEEVDTCAPKAIDLCVPELHFEEEVDTCAPGPVDLSFGGKYLMP